MTRLLVAKRNWNNGLNNRNSGLNDFQLLRTNCTSDVVIGTLAIESESGELEAYSSPGKSSLFYVRSVTFDGYHAKAVSQHQD